MSKKTQPQFDVVHTVGDLIKALKTLPKDMQFVEDFGVRPKVYNTRRNGQEIQVLSIEEDDEWED